jgi:hypothetical protein
MFFTSHTATIPHVPTWIFFLTQHQFFPHPAYTIQPKKNAAASHVDFFSSCDAARMAFLSSHSATQGPTLTLLPPITRC